MDQYELLKVIGSGSYGVVWGAYDQHKDEVVAIKILKRRYSAKECTNMREINALQEMHHPNIVKLKEIIREYDDSVYLVLEYMECSLYDRMKIREKPFSEEEIRNMCFQIFQGLAYMHGNGYFHRDLKPANLLVSKDVIKIADLGLAGETKGKRPYADNAGTYGYQAPEVILHARSHGPAVDMWAMGVIMAELFTRQRLFPCVSAEDQLYKICSVIGSPTESTWSEGLHLADKISYQFPQLPGVRLSSLLPSASPDAFSLIATLLSWNPRMRPTAMEALEHPFIHSCSINVPPVPLPLRRQTLPAVIQMAIKWDFEMEMEMDPALALFKQTTSCTFGLERVDPFMMETKQESLTSTTQSCITDSEELDHPTEYLLHLLSKYQSD